MAGTPLPSDSLSSNDQRIGRAFRQSLWLACGVILLTGLWWSLKQPRTPPGRTPVPEIVLVPPQLPAAAPQKTPFTFRDVTADSGLPVEPLAEEHESKLLPAAMAGGCTVFDFDSDGDNDVLLIGPPARNGQSADEVSSLRLFANDGKCRFGDVTTQAGLALPLAAMGAAAGDYDDDGWVDLFVSGVGESRLLHNAQGQFVDVSIPSGIAAAPKAWGTSCGWCDYDRDGDLDLVVLNYVEWSAELDRSLACSLNGTARCYCRPEQFAGSHPYLFRNQGNGQFEEVSEAAGLRVRDRFTQSFVGKSLGLAICDMNNDGAPDLLVSNDTTPNFLFLNAKGGTFREVGISSGFGVDAAGMTRRQFGLDLAWCSDKSSWCVASGTQAGEALAFYRSGDERLAFTDDAALLGLGRETPLFQTFSPLFSDFDLDGRLDLLLANAHFDAEIAELRGSQSLAQSPVALWNAGATASPQFIAVPPDAGWAQPLAGRGAAIADFDGDGIPEILLCTNRGATRLLHSERDTARHWLRIELTGARAVGASVELTSADGVTQRWQAYPHRGYLSQSELAITFGIEAAQQVRRVRVDGLDGEIWERSDLPADQTIRLVFQKGTVRQLPEMEQSR